MRREQGLVDAQERGDEEGVVQRAAEPARDAGPAEHTPTVMRGKEFVACHEAVRMSYVTVSCHIRLCQSLQRSGLRDWFANR